MPIEKKGSEACRGDPSTGGFCMEPSLYPILHPGSDRVAEHTTHVWAHTKSAS